MVTYRVEDFWDVLGDRTRRAIVEQLASGPRAVGDLARDLPVSRPAVSQHLKILKSAGLVRDRPAGTRRLYQLNPAGIEALRVQLDQFWSQALTVYREVAEQSNDQDGNQSEQGAQS